MTESARAAFSGFEAAAHSAGISVAPMLTAPTCRTSRRDSRRAQGNSEGFVGIRFITTLIWQLGNSFVHRARPKRRHHSNAESAFHKSEMMAVKTFLRDSNSLPPPGSSRWFNGFCTTLHGVLTSFSSSAKAVEAPGRARWRWNRRRKLNIIPATSRSQSIRDRPAESGDQYC